MGGRLFRLFVLTGVLLASLLPVSGGAQVKQVKDEGMKAVSTPVRLVITGASYAGGWDRPVLPGFEVTNKGVSGEETHQVLARFERDVLATNPAMVILWGHINNIHRAPGGDFSAAIARAKGDYEAMLAAARGKGIQVVLATEVTLPEAIGLMNRFAALVGRIRGKEGYSSRINAQVRELNEWLRITARHQGLQLLDFERQFDDGRGFRRVEFTTEDGSHISPSGYAALTEYTRAQLKPPVAR